LERKLNDFEIRQIAEEVTSEIEKVKDVAITKEIGGRTRELKVVLDKDKMAENGVDALGIMQMIQANNGSSQSGSFVSK
jgi:multidrug efflux pump subunit AcrB